MDHYSRDFRRSRAFLFVFIGPLRGRIRSVNHELRLVEEQLAVSRADVESARKLQFNGPLLSRDEISRAMDEITKIGKAFNINFFFHQSAGSGRH